MHKFSNIMSIGNPKHKRGKSLWKSLAYASGYDRKLLHQCFAMRFPVLGRWEDAETGEVLLDRLFVAENFWQRFRGLQFARPLDPGSGLLLRNCRSVHTMWMRFPIDVVFLCESLEISEVQNRVNPWNLVIPRTKDIAHVIEMQAGNDLRLKVGARTIFRPIASHV